MKKEEFESIARYLCDSLSDDIYDDIIYNINKTKEPVKCEILYESLSKEYYLPKELIEIIVGNWLDMSYTKFVVVNDCFKLKDKK